MCIEKMYGIIAGLLLTPDLGTLYSLTPIILIIIFIAAATGISTGRSIFDTFGIGALLGFTGGSFNRGGVGKGFGAGAPKPAIGLASVGGKISAANMKVNTKALGASKTALKNAKLESAAQILSNKSVQPLNADALRAQARQNLLQGAGVKMAVVGAGAVGVSAYFAGSAINRKGKHAKKETQSRAALDTAVNRVNSSGGNTINNRLKLKWEAWKYSSEGVHIPVFSRITGTTRFRGASNALQDSHAQESAMLTNRALKSAYAQLTPAERAMATRQAKEAVKAAGGAAPDWQRSAQSMRNYGIVGGTIIAASARVRGVRKAPQVSGVDDTHAFAAGNPKDELESRRYRKPNLTIASSHNFGFDGPGKPLPRYAPSPAQSSQDDVNTMASDPVFKKSLLDKKSLLHPGQERIGGIPYDLYLLTSQAMASKMVQEESAIQQYGVAWKKRLNAIPKTPAELEAERISAEEASQRRQLEKQAREAEERNIREKRELEKSRQKKRGN